MSLPFIAFHMRDYQRDTQQLPLEGHGAYFLLLQYCWTHGRIPPDDTARASICKVPVQRWRKQLAPLVAGYFDADGCNKRATIEIAKAEKMRLQRAMAGHNGGAEAAKKKALKNLAVATAVATAADTAVAQRPSDGSYSGREAIKRKEDLTSSFVGTARASENSTNSTPEIVEGPAGFAEKAREAVQKSASTIGSGELAASLQAKRWVKP